MGFVNCKNAAQFPFMQPKNTSLGPNKPPLIDFGLNLLATGHVEQTIRISVVMSPVNFLFFNRVEGGSKTAEVKSTYFLLCKSSPGQCHPSSIYAQLGHLIKKCRENKNVSVCRPAGNGLLLGFWWIDPAARRNSLPWVPVLFFQLHIFLGREYFVDPLT